MVYLIEVEQGLNQLSTFSQLLLYPLPVSVYAFSRRYHEHYSGLIHVRCLMSPDVLLFRPDNLLSNPDSRLN